MKKSILQHIDQSFLPRIEFYDNAEDFLHSKYFVARYKAAPSEMSVTLKMKGSYEAYLKILDELGLKEGSAEFIFKEWRIPGRPKEGDDRSYPSNFFLVGGKDPLLIEVTIGSDYSTINFYFDHKKIGLERRLLRLSERLRDAYTVDEQAVFYVLCVSGGNFYTREIDVKPFAIDIGKQYNDDFAPVNKVIAKRVNEDCSGLILLHGLPGTGKTSYIKHLIASNLEREFIFIPNDFVANMLEPGFINFLLNKKDSILVIEDAEKVIMSRQSTRQNSVVSTILQITDGLFSDFLNIKVICTFNTDVSKIDQALFRKGRMIAFYEFGELSKAKARAIVGNELALPASLTLAELYNLKVDNFKEEISEKRIGFHA